MAGKTAGNNWVDAGLGIASAFLTDYTQNRANKTQASSLREQAGIYGSMADSSLRAAGMYAGQARMSAKLGKANARNLRLAAAHLDQFEQLALRNATLEARQRVGAGRTEFAANGVMVDTGAAARWEQDEAADAALERLDIMQQFEDQSWQYRTQANVALAEGYAAAAGHAGAAMGAAGDAYAACLQQAAALSQAKKKKKKSWWGTIGAVVGTGVGAVVGSFVAPGAGTALGASIGGGLGGGLGGIADAT